jgi:hypothetical protein
MAQTQQKNNMILSFVSAFAGMVVAVPVAVTVSAMVVKASFAEEQTQLAYSVSQLSKQINDPTFKPIHSTSATVQTGGDVAVVSNGSCVGDAQPVAAAAPNPGHWSGSAAVKSAYKPHSKSAHISNSFNTTVNNTTHNSSWTYTDSYNTVGSHNHSTTTNHSQYTSNVASNNTVTGNTLNHNSNNNSGNTATTNTTNTTVNTTVNSNSNNTNSGNTNSGNTTIASGNTLNHNSNNTDNSHTTNNVLSNNTTNVDSNNFSGNTVNKDSNNTQVGAFQNI